LTPPHLDMSLNLINGMDFMALPGIREIALNIIQVSLYPFCDAGSLLGSVVVNDAVPQSVLDGHYGRRRAASTTRWNVACEIESH